MSNFSYKTPASPDTSALTGSTSTNSLGSLFTATTTGVQTVSAVISTILSDNKKIAFEPYNNQFTLSDGTTGYSALHYATTIELTGLDALANVNITNIADNEIISYDNATSKFINAKLAFDNIASGVVLDSDTMSGTSATTLATSESIKAYVDAQVTAQDLDFQGDSGGAQSIDLDSEILTLTGGTGINTTGSSETITFAIDDTVATLAGNQILTTKSIDADNNTISNLEVDNLKSGVLDTDLNSASSNDDTLASAKAIKAYVDSREDAHDELSELTDVNITSAADGAMLLYDTGTSKWIDNVMSGDATMLDTGAITLTDGNSTRTNLGLAIGSDVQAYDAGLASISGLTTAADKMIYTTGSNTYAVTDLTATARTLLDDADTSTMRTTLGLAIGSDVQAHDSDLDTLAGLSKADNNFIVGSGSAWVVESGTTARTSLGLGATAVTGVDDATIEIDSSNLRVKADGINDTHIDFGTGTNQVNTDDLTEGSTNLYHTTTRARASVSATDGGGDGSFAYDSSTGVFTYTGPSASEVRSHLSAGTALTYNSGVFAVDLLDEDNMVSNSATKPASQQSIKAYVDSVAEGLDVKNSVKVTTTANITLANTQTIDGVSLSAGDRVLVKDQSTGSQNGVYVVVNGGSWTRATDFDSNTEVTDGTFFFVEQGTLYADSGWVLTTNNPITVGSTALVFSQFSGAGQITAGTGLSKSGNTINADDATTSAKGIASFNTNHFTVSSGAVSVKTLNQSTTGNAATATALASAVDINGISFDGSADITVTSAAGTLTGNTLASGVTASSLTSVGTIATGVWNGTAIADAYISSASTWNAKQDALTFGIADNNAVKITDADAANNDYAKFTALGIEGRSYAEVISDIGAIDTAGTGLTKSSSTLSVNASQTQITAIGTIGTGAWQATNIAIAHGGTGSSTASGARTNLGVAVGSDVQAYDAQLDTLSALTANQVGGLVDLATLEAPASDGQFIVATGSGAFAYESGSTARTSLGLGTAAVLDSVDEDNMASNSATLLPTQQSVKAYVDANSGSNPTGAQTGITSILNNSLVVGRDADNDIDFATDNQIIFRANGADQIKLIDGALVPVTDNDIDLGTSSLEFKNLYIDGTANIDTAFITTITSAPKLTNNYLWMGGDGQIMYWGINFEVTLTHIHNEGLRLNTDKTLSFRDSAINIGSPADGDLAINADAEIELNSTLIDINGAVDISNGLASNTSGADANSASDLSGDFGTWIRVGDGIGNKTMSNGTGLKIADAGVVHWSVGQLAGHFRISKTSADKDELFPSSRNDYFSINNSTGVTSLTGLTVAANTDATTTLGRALIHSPTSDAATFSHVDKTSLNDYALLQSANGTTYVNASSSRSINFNINNSNVAAVNSSGLSVTGAISGDSLAVTTISTTGGIDVQNSDTTLTRVSAGVIAVEGKNLSTVDDATALAIALG